MLSHTAGFGQKRTHFLPRLAPFLDRMDIDEATRTIILKLKGRVGAGGDGYMYGNRSKAIQDTDTILAFPSSAGVRSLLLPTANLQELSIECGWGSEFNELAAELEEIWS